MLRQFLAISQVVVSISLIILILMQARGTGFGRSGGGGSFTRRGLEKLIFKLTFITVFLFLLISLLLLFV